MIAERRCWWCGHTAEVDTSQQISSGLVQDDDDSWLCLDGEACVQRRLGRYQRTGLWREKS